MCLSVDFDASAFGPGFAMIQVYFSGSLLVTTEILMFANDCFVAGDGLELHGGQGGRAHALLFFKMPSYAAMHLHGANSQRRPTSARRPGCVSILAVFKGKFIEAPPPANRNHPVQKMDAETCQSVMLSSVVELLASKTEPSSEPNNVDQGFFMPT